MPEGPPIIVKRQKKHAHVHHGGAWKVAYADFVTAMMAFFLVLWILGMDDEQKALIQSYFQNPMGFFKTMPRAIEFSPLGKPQNKKTPGASTTDDGQTQMSVETSDFTQLAQDIRQALEGGGEALYEISQHVKIEMTGEGLQINLFEEGGVVFFESGSSTVRPAARPALVEISRILAKSGYWVVVDGHTDARPYASSSYDNMALSGDRARAVHRIFREAGMPEAQVIAVRGFGDKRLYKPDDPYHFSNRRVTVLLPFTQVAEQIRGLERRELPTDAIARYDRAKLRPQIRPAPIDLKPKGEPPTR